MLALLPCNLSARVSGEEVKPSCESFFFDEMTYSPVETVFKLFAPDGAKQVLVRIYKDGEGGKAQKTIKMRHVGKD